MTVKVEHPDESSPQKDDIETDGDLEDDVNHNSSDSDYRPNKQVTLNPGQSRRSSSRRKSAGVAVKKTKSRRKGTPRKLVIILTALQKRQNYLASLDKRYPCLKCPKQYPLSAMLKIHSRRHGGSDVGSRLSCKHKNCLNDLQRQRCLSSSTSSNTLQCHICKQDFKFRSEFQKHFKQIHELCFRCKRCPLSFPTVAALTRHLSLRHGKTVQNQSTVTCPHCLKVFLHHSNFAKHTIAAHPETATAPRLSTSSRKLNLKCRLCGKQYVSVRHFEKHLTSHGLSQDAILKEMETVNAGEITSGVSRFTISIPLPLLPDIYDCKFYSEVFLRVRHL